MFETLKKINTRPAPFQFYTADALWTDEHTSKKMLEFHLDESKDLSSRNKAFIEQSARWIISRFNIEPNKSVADFGCGPGLYTTLFAETGAEVTGIDFSKRSLEYARETASRKGLDISYHHQNYLAFDTKKKFDLITMIFCDFCALSPTQRKTLLGKFSSFLKPSGSVLFDVHSLNIFNGRVEESRYERNQLNGFWSPDEYFGFVNSFKYPDELVTLDKYTIIERSRTRVIYNWLQYFSLDSLRTELEMNGFNPTAFYSDVAGTPYREDTSDIAVIAKRTQDS